MTGGSPAGELLRELVLPRPHSVNAMRRANHHSTAMYRRWQSAACAEIMAQGPRKLIEVPVYIDMQFPAGAVDPSADTDNCAKCMLDAIVSMGILIDDNRRCVPMLLLRWHAGAQTIVRLYEFKGEVL